MHTILLRCFLLFFLFFVCSCESNKGFSFYNDDNVVEAESEDRSKSERIDEVLIAKDKEKQNEPKKKSQIKEGNLSDLSEMGQARKDKSEIISFFFDLFDTDDEEEKPKKQKASKEKRVQAPEEDKNSSTKASKNLKLEKNKSINKKIVIKPIEEKLALPENDYSPKKEKIKQLNDNLEKITEPKLDKVNPEKNIEQEDLAFFLPDKKKIEEKPSIVTEVKYENIGMLIPLTGKKKAAGELVMNSLRYSMSTNPGKLVFKIYDTKGSPAGAIEAAKQGVKDGIRMFIGPIFSDETREIKNYFSGHKATFFSLSPDFSNTSENIVVSGENPDDQIMCIKKNLNENQLERVLLIFQNNRYGQVVKESFTKSQSNDYNKLKVDYFELSDFVNLNDEIKVLSRFESRKLRLNEEINRVKKDKTLTGNERKFQVKNLEKQLTLDVPYDAVIVASQGDKLIEILSHLAFYDINSNNTFIYGTSLWEDTKKLDKVFEGTYYVSSLKEKTKSFEQDFKDIFSKEPISFNYYIYDLIDLVSNFQISDENQGNIYFGEFSNSQVNLGLLRRETFLKKVLKNDKVLNISSCSLSEL